MATWRSNNRKAIIRSPSGDATATMVKDGSSATIHSFSITIIICELLSPRRIQIIIGGPVGVDSSSSSTRWKETTCLPAPFVVVLLYFIAALKQ